MGRLYGPYRLGRYEVLPFIDWSSFGIHLLWRRLEDGVFIKACLGPFGMAIEPR